MTEARKSRRGGVQKSDLLKWVNDQRQLKMRAKYILKELASFAGEDCCAWVQVATLAQAANCEDRCVQYNIRELEKAGLICRTGRLHRLENSSRSVPIYQLAPDVEGLGKPESMGAEIAPIAAYGCKNDPSMGAKGVHPYKEYIGVQEEAHASSEGAGEREALFVQLNEACPAGVLKVTDNDAAWLAFNDLARRGVDLTQLPTCMSRMAVDPLFLGRRIPTSLEAWLAKGQWRGWLSAAATEAQPRTPFVLPGELVEQLCAIQGVDAYLRGVTWSEADRTICVPTSIAQKRLVERIGRDRLAKLNITIAWRRPGAAQEGDLCS